MFYYDQRIKIKRNICNCYLNLRHPYWRIKKISYNAGHKIKLLRNVKMAVFDLDGTLINCSNCWKLITEYYSNMQHSAKSNFKNYIKGKIGAQQFYENTIDLWNPPPNKEFFFEVCKKLEFNPGAVELIKYLKNANMEIAIVSTGIDIITEYISNLLGIKRFFANTLNFNKDGILNRKVEVNVTFGTKTNILERLSKGLNIVQDQIMFVGDSRYDVESVRWAGVGVFFDNANIFKREADIIISSLEDLAIHFKKIG